MISESQIEQKQPTDFPIDFRHLIERSTKSSELSTILNSFIGRFQCQKLKFGSFSAADALEQYNDISAKYDSGEIPIQQYRFHQKERKICSLIILLFLEIIPTPQENKKQLFQVKEVWEQMSKLCFSKNPLFLKFNYLDMLKNTERVTWSQSDDQLLKRAMQEEGQNQWRDISRNIFVQSKGKLFKKAVKCRQRWLNHMNPTLTKGQWTSEEDNKILQFADMFGKQWARIAHEMKNTRSQHMIKNRYNKLINKKKKQKISSKKNKKAKSVMVNEPKDITTENFLTISKILSKQVRDEIEQSRSILTQPTKQDIEPVKTFSQAPSSSNYSSTFMSQIKQVRNDQTHHDTDQGIIPLGLMNSKLIGNTFQQHHLFEPRSSNLSRLIEPRNFFQSTRHTGSLYPPTLTTSYRSASDFYYPKQFTSISTQFSYTMAGSQNLQINQPKLYFSQMIPQNNTMSLLNKIKNSGNDGEIVPDK